MHMEYWETKGSMMEIEEISRFEGVNLGLITAERNLKKSLACAASREEVDYSNVKLSKEDLTRLVIRLKMLQRNIELKGKALEGNMSEPSLLGVLERKIQKFLLKIQAYGRTRRPKGKRRSANPKKSTRMLPNPKMAEACNEHEVKGKLQVNQLVDGRINLFRRHNKKFFKENFKPP